MAWLWLRRGAGALLLGASLAAMFWSVRIASADWIRRGATRESILAAIGMFPENWAWYRDLAEISAGDAVWALEAAVRLNPRNSLLAGELGEYAEKAGAYEKAEQSLLRAVSIDRTFAPRLLLTEFYFRRRAEEKFWVAARTALEAAGESVGSVFEDCWALRADADYILAAVVPNRPEILRLYLDFLLSRNAGEGGWRVAERMMRQGVSAEGGATLLTYCDRLIGAGSAARAVQIWNYLAGRGLVGFSQLSPERGAVLTNGDFGKAATGRGFDWRLSSPGGVFWEQRGLAGGIELTLTGKEPENCDLLQQFVPVLPGARYRLVAGGAGEMPGLVWRVLTVAGVDVAGEGKAGLFRIAVPPDTSMLRVALRYERPKGMVRAEGVVRIGPVRMEVEGRPERE